MNILPTPRRPRQLSAALALVFLLSACSGDKPETMVASARDFLAKNEPKAAIIQLKNALQANPELPEARYLLGVSLMRGGDAVGSETELRKALALKHPQDEVVPALVTAMLAQGQFKKVTDEFGSTELGPANARAALKTTLANAWGAQGNAAQARASLDAAIAADPAYAPALILQARDKAATRDLDGALAVLDGILARTPTNFEAWKLKGDIQVYGKNLPEEGMASYRKAIEVRADYLPAHSAIFNMLMQQAKLPEATTQLTELKKVAPNNPEVRYFETLLAYRKKDLKAARELAQQLIRVAPESPLALQLAGAIELDLKSALQAEAYLSKAVANAPDAVLARRLLVTSYLRSGQPAKALTALQPALRGNDVSLATLTLAGEVYLQNGDVKKAEDAFARAAKLDPKNTRARTALALTHLAGGKEESAFAELQDIAASEDATMADMALISAHLRRGELDRALKAIDGLEKKQPDKPLAANLRGRTLLAKKDVAGARKSFERSVAIDPTYFPSVASLAALDMADKKPEEARKRFEAVLAQNPKHGQALLALAELRAREGGKKEEVAELITRAITANPTETTPRLLLIELHLRTKEFKQAVTVAQAAVAASPDSPELLDALGRAQEASGETNQALATYNKVAAMQPLSPMPHMRMADAYMRAKNKDGAAQSLRKALDIKADHLDAQVGLIRLAVDAKNFQDAQAMARTIQQQRPKAPVGYQFEGDIAAAQKNWDAAADAFKAGLKLGPVQEIATRLVSVYDVAGKTAERDRFVATWLRDHPKDVAFRLYLGDIAITRKDFPGAERHYLSAMQIQPQNAIALNNLAWVSGQMKKDNAIGYAEKANALAPNQPAFMDTLAMLLSEKNDYQKAVELQNKAVALQPDNGTYKLNLAKIHIKGGNKDLARKELDALAKLGDKFGGQGEVASLLKTL